MLTADIHSRAAKEKKKKKKVVFNASLVTFGKRLAGGECWPVLFRN